MGHGGADDGGVDRDGHHGRSGTGATTLGRGAAAAIVAAAVLFMLTAMNTALTRYDEAIIAQGAVEVLNGAVPHRDFYFNYGPGQLWMVAGLFAAFGKTLTAARLYDVAVRAAILVACAASLRRLRVPPRIAVTALAIEAMMMAGAGLFLPAALPVVLAALVGSLLLAPVTGTGGTGTGGIAPTRRLVAAGAVTGVAALFRYDAGFFLLAGHLAALVAIGIGTRTPLVGVLRAILLYGCGTAIAFLPVAGAAVVVGVLPGFAHDIIAYPSTYYVAMRSLPLPLPGPRPELIANCIAYVPLPAAALALIALLDDRREALSRSAGRLLIVLMLVTAIFFLKAMVRLSFVHAVLAAVPAGLVLAGTLAHARRRPVRIATVMVGALWLVTTAAAVGSQVRLALAFPRSTAAARIAGAAPPGMARRDCPEVAARLGIATTDADSFRAACFLARHTRPDERIFVGAGRHDRLVLDNVGLYFLADRRPATHWYHFDPGLQTRADVQARIVRDLDAGQVRLVALDRFADDIREPNASARSSGVFLLDRYLAAHYRPVARFGKITVLARRPSA